MGSVASLPSFSTTELTSFSLTGGFAFITNMLPLHVFVLLLMGRFTTKIYVAYSTYYIIGTLAAMSVPFVGYQPVRNSEHMSALGVFGLLQLVAFGHLCNGLLPRKQFRLLLTGAIVIGSALATVALAFLTQRGYIAPWTGRFYSLWDTGYAKVHIPIIASVSEHQPTAWPAFFFDLHILIYLFPVGVFYCFRELRNEHIFVITYALVGSYFAGVMVRLMLTLTPCVCVASSSVVARLYEAYLAPTDTPTDNVGDASAASDSPAKPVTRSSKKKSAASSEEHDEAEITSKGIVGWDARALFLGFFSLLLVIFCLHCTWVTSNAYSSPSVVLASRTPQGEQVIIDDFREAYYWLRQNTKKDAKVMSWWDYGYQLAGFADRTTLVDVRPSLCRHYLRCIWLTIHFLQNATWNNTQCVLATLLPADLR